MTAALYRVVPIVAGIDADLAAVSTAVMAILSHRRRLYARQK